jgi:hypothetical protein
MTTISARLSVGTRHCFSGYRPLDHHHRRHHCIMTQVGHKRDGLPMACGTWPISRTPRAQRPRGRAMLVEVAVSSTNTNRAGSNRPCSRRARATSAAFAPPRAWAFLTVMWCRAKNRQTAVRLPTIAWRRQSRPESNPDAWRPVREAKPHALPTATCCRRLGLAAALPNRTNRCIHCTAELTLTSNRSAASCRNARASTHSTNRIRRSKE